jgi:hypothetical protein
VKPNSDHSVVPEVTPESLSPVARRAEMLRQLAEKWHDEETLGDATCEYRLLEIQAFIAGYVAAEKAERERCAGICDGVAAVWATFHSIAPAAAQECAANIRKASGG